MKKKNPIFPIYMGIFMIVTIITGCTTPTETAPVQTQENTSTTIPATPTSEITEEITQPAEASEGTMPVVDSSTLDGSWEGSLTIAGSSLGTKVHFRTENDSLSATLDIPAQNLFGYSLANVTFDGSTVHFEGFEEASRKAVWEGKITEDGKISGTFTQLTYTGTFELARSELITTEAVELPYKEEEVSIQNGEITLGGTLSLPEGTGPFPAIVLITGSGAQNRDEEIYGFKIFGTIADHLSRNGFAVLRYDDRGVGASTGSIDDSTSSDFAGDVLAWVNYLKTRPEIDAAHIGLMGHSEGGIIAPMVALQSKDVAFIVLMAGPAITGEEIIYKQVELIARAQGSSDEEIDAALQMQYRLFDGLLRGEDWEGAKAELHQQITDQVNALTDVQKQSLGDLDQYIEKVYQQQIDSLESAWYRYFLAYDPAPTLEQITIPVLALFGGKDLQVPADPNAESMKTALEKAGNQNVTIITYPEANHLFQDAETGSPDEYATLKPEFLEGFLDDLTNWLRTEQY